jgi:hypothetical protein
MLIIGSGRAYQPATRAGARRLGAFTIVFFAGSIVAILARH